jgi:ribosome recycling factor
MSTDLLARTERRMRQAIVAMERDFDRIRTGAASASLVDAVRVDHGGRRARLVEIATVTIPDPRQIVIRPWDPTALRAIGAAISQSRIGLSPTIDGPAIRLYVPAMTEERRRELVGLVHRRAEQARVDIRAIRHEALAVHKAAARSHELGGDDARRESAALQALTDRRVAEVDRLAEAKEVAILRI